MRIRGFVAEVYYTHGLMCASHPYFMLVFSIGTFLLACYPLTNLPLPGNVPLEYCTNISDVTPSHAAHLADSHNATETPRWFNGSSAGFVQQIVIKAAVHPWNSSLLIPIDGLRGPLGKVFDILETLESHRQKLKNQTEVSLDDVCLHVGEMVQSRGVKELFPEYGCLLLSPAGLWLRDRTRYSKDAEIVKTVFKTHGAFEMVPTVKDLLFGLPWKDTGITQYYIRNQQRTITYAITIVFKEYNLEYIQGLRTHLETVYPLTGKNVNNTEVTHITHVYYKDTNYFVEYTPLLVTYLVLLLYLYFSVRKIEMVKSKIGLAISAVATVVGSLLISVSCCTFLGLRPTLSGSEIFPYLVVIIGVENVLVFTKSVVSTPVDLEVKYRIAHGLSKESWAITKNLTTELCIVVIGFFTFVPAIQEFCLFALVGILSDFFLQMIFFVTVLSVDIRRMELADLHRQSSLQQQVEEPIDHMEPLIRCPVNSYLSRLTASTSSPPSPLPPTPSLPPKPRTWAQSQGMSGVLQPQGSPPYPPHITSSFPQRAILQVPRRLRLLFFWARARLFQRLIMGCVVVWISLIIYKAGLMEQLTSSDPDLATMVTVTSHQTSDSHHPDYTLGSPVGEGEGEKGGAWLEEALSWLWSVGRRKKKSGGGPLEHHDLMLWQSLSYKHWTTLLALYNLTLWGRYISVLPTIHLSVAVEPEVALRLRLPEDAQDSPPLAELPSPGQGADIPPDNPIPPYVVFMVKLIRRFYPRSFTEGVVSFFIVLLGVIVIGYFGACLYRIICSRNYPKWRRKWRMRRMKRGGGYIKQVKDTVPLVLAGHPSEVECVAADHQYVVSVCLAGQVRIWDSNTGNCVTTIRRTGLSQLRGPGRLSVGGEDEDFDTSHTEVPSSPAVPVLCQHPATDKQHVATEASCTSPRSGFRFSKPDLRSTINTDFSNIEPSSASEGQGFDFERRFEGLYEEHRRGEEEEEEEEEKRSGRQRMSLTSQEASLLASSLDTVRSRSLSTGDHPGGMDFHTELAPVVWCMACRDGLIVLGCSNGQLEFWEAETGVLRTVYEGSSSGVQTVSLTSSRSPMALTSGWPAMRVVVGRIDGHVDFLELETTRTSHMPAPPPPPPSGASRPLRGHVRHISSSSDIRLWDDLLQVVCRSSVRVHQRPVMFVQAENGRAVSASQDHTLKVFNLEDYQLRFTLHGHEGSISTLFLEKSGCGCAVSGAVDGCVRVWELQSGLCRHMLHAHKGTVVSVATTATAILSLGLDERICVWDYGYGHLIHCLSVEGGYLNSNLCLLDNTYLVTGGQGCLHLWDIVKGEMVRRIHVDTGEHTSSVNHVVLVGSMAVVCDTGTLLNIISFPTVLVKAD